MRGEMRSFFRALKQNAVGLSSCRSRELPPRKDATGARVFKHSYNVLRILRIYAFRVASRSMNESSSDALAFASTRRDLCLDRAVHRQK